MITMEYKYTTIVYITMEYKYATIVYMTMEYITMELL